MKYDTIIKLYAVLVLGLTLGELVQGRYIAGAITGIGSVLLGALILTVYFRLRPLESARMDVENLPVTNER